MLSGHFQCDQQGDRGSTPGIPQNQNPNQTASRMTSALTSRRRPTVSGCTELGPRSSEAR